MKGEERFRRVVAEMTGKPNVSDFFPGISPVRLSRHLKNGLEHVRKSLKEYSIQ